jgi:hypothetical protein
MSLRKLVGIFIVASAATLSHAQGGWGGNGWECETAINAGYSVQLDGDNLLWGELGVSSSVQFGGTVPGPPPDWCLNPNVSLNAAGAIGFGTGVTGSIQAPIDGATGLPSDAYLALTWGFPWAGGNEGYACVTTDSPNLDGKGTRARFGANGYTTTFVGASDRYIFAEAIVSNITVDLRMDFIGDCCRLQWTMTNSDTAVHTVGLWFGQYTAMVDNEGNMSGWAGLPPANGASSKNGYVVVPGIIPPTVEHRYFRAQSPATFPSFIDFDFGQTFAYGTRVENGPNPDTSDSNDQNSDCTQVDEFALGQAFFLLGPFNGNGATFPDTMFGVGNTGGDVTYIDNPGYIQKYYEQSLSSGSNRQIIQYVRSTWGVSNYFKPYSVVLDAPQLIPTDTSTSTGLAIPPAGYYTIRVYVDNTRGFSTADQSMELDNVAIKITLPSGINLVNGETATKVIPRIQAGNASNFEPFVDFHVLPDGIALGPLSYSVSVTPTPGPVKSLTGTIFVAATPKLPINAGANLLSTPWNFADSSWEAILGLVAGQDFTAYQWDPIQNGYVTATSASRGSGYWIVASQPYGERTLQSSPTVPADITTGARAIQLQQGWNLIGNPYNYAIPLGQILGATNANTTTNFTWDQLVSQGFVNGALAYYNTSTGGYSYVQADTDLLEPNVGYWIYVTVAQPLTIAYPPVYEEFVPNSNRSKTNPWTQTNNQWHLQMSVRQNGVVDGQNFLGVASTPAIVQKLQIAKPPVLPTKAQAVSLAFTTQLNGKSTRMAQVLSTPNSKLQYSMSVTSPQAGEVTVTWPNIKTLPNTVQARIIDTATTRSVPMNQVSGYTYTAQAGQTRTFTIQVQPGTPGRAVIGNVIVSSSGRAPGSPMTISYTLSNAATTTVQIINRAGAAIYQAISGRSDAVGTNSVVWNLRDSANRNVAPGPYTVVIMAVTPDGQASRRVVPVNVTR